MAVPQPGKGPPALQRVGVREFRGNMPLYLRQARDGMSFLITSHDQVLAEIHPPSKTQNPRREPGALKGRITLAPDFDTFPADVLDAMEGARG